MDTFTIYTLGGGDILFTVFNALASLLNPQTGSLITLIVSVGTVVGGTMAVWMMVFRGEAEVMGKWFITYTILITGIMSPISTVRIKDSMTNQVRVVDHVPFILAFGSSFISSFGNGLTQVIEQAFQPSPTDMVGGIGLQGNLTPSYSKTGFVFGADVLQNMKRVAFDNADIESNMHGFVNQCVTYDALIGKKYTLHDLKHSPDLWRLVSTRASQMRGFPWRNVERDATNKFIRSHGTEIITCKEGAHRLNAHWQIISASSFDDFAKKIGINQAWSKNQNIIANQVKSHLPGALEKVTNNSKTALQHIQQQLMISSILKGSEQKSIELGGSPNFEVRRAYLQQRDTYQTIGHVIAQGLPSIKNVLEAILYCMFIFVIALILMPSGHRLLLFYFKILIWLQLWAPLFAILNFIMTEALSWRAISAMKGVDGITIGNFVGLSNMASDMSAMAGYLCSVIPVMSWMLLERGGYAFVNMASNILGVAQGAATQAAQEKSTGNYSFGNSSMGNVQAYTATQLKQDYAPSYTGHGHMTSNSGSSTLMTDSSGEQILTMNESHLPVSLNVAASQENALRETQRNAYTAAEGEQQSAMSARQQTQNEYLEIGKQAQHMISSGHQFSDQQQAQVMREAADHYSKVENLSDKTGLSKDYVNQKALEFNGGLNMGANIGKNSSFVNLAADIGGKLSKTESSNMSAHQAAESILELGKNTGFNQSHQQMDTALKSKTFDTNNQELKQAVNNFSSSYENTRRHEESAHKSFEHAQSLDKEIAYTKNNSSSINASHTQPFVNFVGADKIKKMSVQEQANAAHNYAQSHAILEQQMRGSRGIKTEGDIKSTYDNAKIDHKNEGIKDVEYFHNEFRQKYYEEEKPKGVRGGEVTYLEQTIDQKQADNQKKMMVAEDNAKMQQVRAHQTFNQDMKVQAEDHQGLTQEGVTKDLLKSHGEKKKNA